MIEHTPTETSTRGAYPIVLKYNRVFLAGSIEQGRAVDWQEKVCVALENLPVEVYNPRRKVWLPNIEQTISNPEFKRQVEWEAERLELAEVIFFFFQAGTYSPISLLEYGKCLWAFKKTVVVVEPGFWRRGNIEVEQNREGLPIFDSLEEGIAELLKILT